MVKLSSIFYGITGAQIIDFIWWFWIHFIASWVISTALLRPHIKQHGMHHCVWEIFIIFLSCFMLLRALTMAYHLVRLWTFPIRKLKNIH